MATLGASVTAVDGAAEMIAAAQRLGGGGGVLVYRTCGDLARLPEEDESFDGVLCSSLLEYLDEPGQVLTEFWRVTKAGGTLIVTLPNRRALVRKAERLLFGLTSAFRRSYPPYLAHVKVEWDRREAIALLGNAGYEARSVTPGGLGYAPSWLGHQTFWGPLLFISAIRLPARGPHP